MKKKEEKVPFCFPLSFCVSLFLLRDPQNIICHKCCCIEASVPIAKSYACPHIPDAGCMLPG